MDTVLALGDNLHDLFKPVLGCITDLQSRSGDKAGIVDCEDYGIKYRLLFLVKWAINKYVVFILYWHNSAYFLRCFL